MSDPAMNELIRRAARSRQQGRQSEAARRLVASLTRTRVFVSFDYDQMRFEARALGEQLRRSPRFSVENWSMKEAAPERLWADVARQRLNRSDVMVIVCNSNTYGATGVLTEVKIARELGVPIRQVYPARYRRPLRVPSPSDPVTKWTHDNLERLLKVPRRRAGA